MLPDRPRRLVDPNPRTRPLEYFRIALVAGNRFTGLAGGVHHGRDGNGRGAIGLLQQHANFSKSSTAGGASGARRGGAGAAWHRAPGGATAGGNVVRPSPRHSDV